MPASSSNRRGKPDVDSIEGLSPAIAIEQKSGSRNPRSSVGTITEIYDYLRLLWARAGEVFCWKCGQRIFSQTIPQMVDRVLGFPEGTRFSVLAPVVRDKKGDHAGLARLRQDGYVRANIDGELHELAEPPKLDKTRKHTIEVFIDRLVRKAGHRAAPGRIDRAGGQAGRRSGQDLAAGGRRPAVLAEVRLPGLRRRSARDRAQPVLVQQPGGRLPGVRRHRRHHVLRPGAGGHRSRAVPARGRHRSLGTAQQRLLPAAARRGGGRLRHRSVQAVEQAAAGTAQADPGGLRRQGDHLRLREERPQAHLQEGVRRRARQPATPLRRVPAPPARAGPQHRRGFRGGVRRVPSLHVAVAVRGMRGHAPAQGGAQRARGRQEHRRGQRAHRRGGARVHPRPWPCPDATGRSATASCAR